MSDAAGTATVPESLMATADALRHSRRRAIEEAYEAAYKRTIRRDTLSALELVVRWLDECQIRQGQGPVFTTTLRAAREIGWPAPEGASYLEASNRVRNSLTRRLDMLVEMAWIRSWSGVVKPDGGKLGIVIHPRRDSSVGEALSLAPAPRQLSLDGNFRVVGTSSQQSAGRVAADLRVSNGIARSSRPFRVVAS